MMRSSMFAPLALALIAQTAAAQLPTGGPAVPRSVSSMPSMAPPAVWAMDRSIVGKMNQAQIGVALAAAGRTTASLTDDERLAIQKSFEDLLPGEQFSRYRLNSQQARAMVFLAFGASERSTSGDRRGDDRRGDYRRGDDRRGDSRSGSRVTRDEFERASDQAEWIRTSVPTLQERNSRRTRDEELTLLQGMSSRARSLDLTVNRANCDGGRGASHELVMATREAIDLHQQSILNAWQGVGDMRLTRIARLADSVESHLVRCAGDN